MKKKIYSLIALTLTIVMTCSMAGCGNGSTAKEETELKSTGYNIVEDGKTEYVIVVPEDPDFVTSLASTEINEFINRSSGATLKIVEEDEFDGTTNKKFISLGETKLLDDAGIVVDKEKLGEGGYVMKTDGESLYISGITEDSYSGTVYGVYDWLADTIGYRCYAEDEFDYKEMKTIPLYKFDKSYRPSIDIREVAYKDIKTNTLYSYRMYSQDSNHNVWNSFAHTTLSRYLPYETYGEAHPDWYTANGDQLCLTNEEVVQEMIVRVKEELDVFPDRNLVTIGHEDNGTICTCDKCTEATARHGGNYSGVELEFTNKVAKGVDEIIAEEQPDRKLTYFFFAYGPTLNAPVEYNESTKEYEPIDKDLEVYENVGVLIAPISMDFAKSPEDGANKAAYESMKGWSALFNKKNIAIWNYCLGPYAYMFNFNNFGVVQEYYRFYEEIGTKVIYDQGNYDSGIPTFSAMRIYCQAQLGWDTSQDYDELANDFIEHYYGEGSTAIKKYYDFIRAYYRELDDNDYATGHVFFLYDDKNIWPLTTVNSIMSYMDEALEAIEPLKESNPERYEQLYNRIQRERMSPIYMMLQYYISQLTDDEKAEYIADFEKYADMYGMESTRESAFDLKSVIENWKKS